MCDLSKRRANEDKQQIIERIGVQIVEKNRIAVCERNTKETQIKVTLNLDGSGNTQINTGIAFFDHMLDGFARHGLFDLAVSVEGDLQVDSHHTIEDTGIVLGTAIAEALGEKKGICRYGNFILPMDETLALCAIDLAGRPYLVFDAPFTVPTLGGLDTEMINEFFYAVSYSAAMNLHLKILNQGNNHHMAEALFKSFGKALDAAVGFEPRMQEVWSTKGSL